jgi:hypothetical protein
MMIGRIWPFFRASGCPVALAQRKMTLAAILKRRPAVVNTPSPENANFMATALDPKRVHKKTTNKDVRKDKSLFEGSS